MARELWRELSADGVGDLAASLSYRFLLALFPFFIFLASVGAFAAKLLDIDNPSTEIASRIASTLPADAASVLTTQLDSVLGDEQPGLLSVGILGALWAAAGGMGALMRAMNIAYDVKETRPFWKRTGIAVGLTLLSGFLIVVAFVVMVAGEYLGGAAANAVGLDEQFAAVLGILRWVFIIVLLLVAAAFLFWASPNAHLPFRWVTPGAIIFILSWLVTTAGFGWYVANFGSYNATYGALGGLIVLMIWFYLTAYIMLAGAELNALVVRRSGSAAAVEQLSPSDGTDPVAQAHAAQHGAEASDSAGVSNVSDGTPPRSRTGRATRAIGGLVALVALRQVMPRSRTRTASRH